jgi:hypothetical protein
MSLTYATVTILEDGDLLECALHRKVDHWAWTCGGQVVILAPTYDQAFSTLDYYDLTDVPEILLDAEGGEV